MKNTETPFWERKLKFTPYNYKEALGLFTGLVIGSIIVIIFSLVF
nr:hypothetical protein [uncultured Psychroserpens sp.]